MRDSQAITQYKSRLFLQNIAKDKTQKLATTIFIQNLMKKSLLFAPRRLGSVQQLQKSDKTICNFKIVKFKKQIEPHLLKPSKSVIDKSKSNLISEKAPEFREPKQRRNISAVWQNKRLSRQKKLQTNPVCNQTASFYLKKGDKRQFYELKMDIKKVQSNTRPIENCLKKLSKNRYWNKIINLQKPKMNENSMNIEQNQIKKQGQQMEYHQNTNQPNRKRDYSKTSIKQQIKKQKYAKQSLMSYPSKTKFIKKKQQAIELPQFEHIKNILIHSFKPNEQSIQFFQYQPICQSEDETEGFLSKNIQLSAQCFSVNFFDSRRNILTPVFAKQSNKRVEIASITKIMTCLLVLNIAKFFRLDIKSQKVLISQRASKMPGTSAKLNYSDIFTVYQLLHALMLPSGNDAAVALAEWGGKTIRKYCSIAHKYIQSRTVDVKNINFLYYYSVEKKTYQKLFIYHMNKATSILNLKDTRFANAHGLMNDRAYSTADDITRLTAIAMSNETFRQVVGQKQFGCKFYNRTYSQTSTIFWKNTNKLLQTQGFVGVKTGVTPSAGPCLSSMFKLNEYQSIIIVMFKVKSMEMRFKETLYILKQALNQQDSLKFECIIGKIGLEEEKTSSFLQSNRDEQANLVENVNQINSDQEEVQDEDEERDE